MIGKIVLNPHASLQARVVAKILDVFIFLIPVLLIPDSLFDSDTLSYIRGFVWFGPLLLSDGMFNGQSPGKKLFRIQVVSVKDGSPCNYFRSFVRNLFLVDFVVIFGAIVDGLVWHSTERRVGDFAASTCVVTLLGEKPLLPNSTD